MSRDGRFRWSALIVLGLLISSLALGWKNYTTVKREQTSAQAQSRADWENQGERNPHSAAHFGVYAFKPKMPLSLIDSGLDNFTGSFIWVEAHYQNPSRGRPIEDATALQRFGELTAAGVLQLLLPLVIIFLTFDAFAGERERGTLRQVLSLGVSRSNLIFGKTAGFLAALSILLVPAVIIGVAALAFATANDILLHSAPRFALLCVGYLLYFGAIIGVSMTVSAYVTSTRTSLVILLGFWILGCLLIPRLSGDFAERFYQTPTSDEFWSAIDKDIKQGVDGHNTANERTKELEKEILEKYGVKKIEDLPVNFSGLALNASEEYGNKVFDKHFSELWKNYYAQEKVHKMSGILSPFMPIRGFSMALAGTDLAENQHFTNAVEQYRREINRFLNLDFAENSSTKDGFKYTANRALWEKSPEFQYTPPPVSVVLSQQLSNLILLIGWCFGSLAAAIFTANRMKAF